MTNFQRSGIIARLVNLIAFCEGPEDTYGRPEDRAKLRVVLRAFLERKIYMDVALNSAIISFTMEEKLSTWDKTKPYQKLEVIGIRRKLEKIREKARLSYIVY